MKLRVIRGWKRKVPGDLMEADRGVADILVRRGIVEIVKEEPPASPAKHKKQWK